jgi:iron(III) transport system substrate-binding protein
MRMRLVAAAILFAGAFHAAGAEEISLYTGRHYDGDQQLYDGFTRATGITVNVIQGKGDELLARLEAEAEASPADVFLTADAGNLWRAEDAGVLQPVESAALAQRIPAQYRDPGNQWFGFSRRARVIFVARDAALPFTIANYEDLARPELKGTLCMRSGSAIYNLSLLGALIDRWGADAAEAWAKGVVANLAKEPQGGDIDQLKSVAAGECAATMANTYYFVRLLRSDKQEDKDAAAKLMVVFPDQATTGTHVNISGAGVARYAPNKAGAVKFLEYLAGDEAQGYFGLGNNEYPVNEGPSGNPELDGLGTFKADPVNVSIYGKNQKAAQEIMDRAGWK